MASRSPDRSGSHKTGLTLIQQSDRVEASLWRRVKLDSDDNALTTLFERYRPLAQKIASAECSRRQGLGYELAEIQQLAFEGLLQAISRYDAATLVPFAAFARSRIRGNILDGLSKSSERSAQYRFRQRAERDRLKSLEPDSPQAGSALEELGRLTTFLAIGLMLEESTLTDPDDIATGEASAYETLAWNEMQQHLLALLENLGERECFVLLQHYRYDVSFTQIAQAIGLTKGRISQIHKAALLRLRAELEKFR